MWFRRFLASLTNLSGSSLHASFYFAQCGLRGVVLLLLLLHWTFFTYFSVLLWSVDTFSLLDILWIIDMQECTDWIWRRGRIGSFFFKKLLINNAKILCTRHSFEEVSISLVLKISNLTLVSLKWTEFQSSLKTSRNGI